jgi:hypothetical protein
MDEMISRALAGASPSQDERPARQINYSVAARSRALDLWETGYVNANGRRPWREAYQAAVRKVSPALDRYTTVDELVAAYYDFALRADVERASHLADGRILNYATVEDAAYWQRYVALTRTDGAEESITWTR